MEFFNIFLGSSSSKMTEYIYNVTVNSLSLNHVIYKNSWIYFEMKYKMLNNLTSQSVELFLADFFMLMLKNGISESNWGNIMPLVQFLVD